MSKLPWDPSWGPFPGVQPGIPGLPPPTLGWPETDPVTIPQTTGFVTQSAGMLWQSEWVKYGVGLVLLLALISWQPKWGWPLAGITVFILLANPATRKNLGLGG